MQPLTILIVEDESVTAADLQQTLVKAGHRITAIAQNFDEALAALSRQRPDLAIIDINLKKSSADGIKTADALLELHWMPIIYLTAHSEPKTIERAKATYPAAYLLKPFQHNELTIQVELAYHNFQANGGHSTNPMLANTVFLPYDKGYDQIIKQNVLYLQAAGSYTHILLRDEKKPRLFTLSLGHLAQYFITPNFFRLSRSLMLNLHHITRLDSNQAIMQNEVAVSIPDKSRAHLLKKLAVIRTR